jgi:hypothetical protein
MSTLTSVVGAAHRIFTDQEGAYSSINTPFSLGERLPISFNALVNNHRLTTKHGLIELWQKP